MIVYGTNVLVNSFFLLIWSIDWLFDWLFDWLIGVLWYIFSSFAECWVYVFLWVSHEYEWRDLIHAMIFFSTIFKNVDHQTTTPYFVRIAHVMYFIYENYRKYYRRNVFWFEYVLFDLNLSVYRCEYNYLWLFFKLSNLLHEQCSLNTHKPTFINFYPFEKWNIKVRSSFRATWFMWFCWGCFFCILSGFNEVISQNECVTKHAINGKRMHFAILSFHVWVYLLLLFFLLLTTRNFFFSSPMLTKRWTNRRNANYLL